MTSKYPPKNGKRALVTGITGQDGSYLAELLLNKGYEVYGIIRRSSSFNTGRIDHIYQDPHDADVRLRLVYADLADGSSLNQLIKTIRPDEMYNLGAQSHVRVSFDIPEYTSDITGLGCIRLLEAIREAGVELPVLSGVVVGAVRQGDRDAAIGADAVLSAQSVCMCQGVRILRDAELPRIVRDVCGERDSVQPRVAAAGRDVRHAEDYAGRGADSRRVAGLSVPGQSRTRGATGATRPTMSTRCGG